MAGTNSSSSSSSTVSSPMISVDSSWEPSLRDWGYTSDETDPNLIMTNHMTPDSPEVEPVEVVMIDSSESELEHAEDEDLVVEVVPIESSPSEIIMISSDLSDMESLVAQIPSDDQRLAPTEGESSSLGIGPDLDLEGWGTSGIDPDPMFDSVDSQDSEETEPTEEKSSSSSSSSSGK
ncbi:suppressor protein SRP40-like [Asparagus officinalis]|uniref:suppressor protein SRP40-like n=1 Tax=Asparagus officinalis TaxID=4686 RepID=UPI00098DE639|nr:suppressor protein SRP40-like [Asparagus officinalis]